MSIIDPGGGGPGGPISGGGGIIDTGGGTTPPSSLTIITSTPLPFATQLVPYSTILQATGNTGTVAWLVSSGTLPDGLALSNLTGILSGVPTTVEFPAFTVQATDSLTSTTKDFTLEIRPALTPPDPSFNENSLADLANQLALTLRDPQHSYWCAGELYNAIIESLRIFQALTGYYRQRASFSTEANEPFYDLRELIPTEYAFTVNDGNLLSEIESHLLEPPTNPWTGTDQFSLAAIQSAMNNVRDAFLFDTGVYISRHQVTGPTPPASRVTLPEEVIHIRRAGWR